LDELDRWDWIGGTALTLASGCDAVGSKPALQKTERAKGVHPLKEQTPKDAAPNFRPNGPRVGHPPFDTKR